MRQPLTIDRRTRHAAASARLACALASLLLLALVGCASSEDELADLPTLDEVRSRVTPPQPPSARGRQQQQQQQQQQQPRVDAMLEQIELPLDVPLEALWEHIDESVFAASTRAAWRTNGMRMGVVSRQRLRDFSAALPEDEVTGLRRQRISSRGEPVALRSGERLYEPVTLHTPGVGQAMEPYEASGGRLRLLTRMQTAQQGRVHLQLLPQHHQRRHSVQPRDPREAELDGEIFEDLAAALTLTGNELLVIGLHDPWPEADQGATAPAAAPDEPNAQSETEADHGNDNRTDDDDETNTPHSPIFELRPADPDAADDALLTPSQRRAAWIEAHGERPELPRHFGRSLLTRRSGDQSIQVLMILSARPLAAQRAERD